MDNHYFHRLRCRRTEVEKTLRHLENEKRTVESNTEWANRAAFESRMNLLYRLTDSFRNEISRIDDALERRDPRRYGLRLSCQEPIETERLQVSAEAQFCIDCQTTVKDRQSAKPFVLWRFIKLRKKTNRWFDSLRTS
jgi:RNA polymerase-binding transcription factor DksA